MLGDVVPGHVIEEIHTSAIRSSNEYYITTFAMTFATFLGVQASNWQRPSKTFHEIMSQPAPHGSYLRRSLKEHFPVWWNDVSGQLHTNGYSLPEMPQYDKSVEIQKTHTRFDPSFY